MLILVGYKLLLKETEIWLDTTTVPVRKSILIA